jgi:hypothetical protein
MAVLPVLAASAQTATAEFDVQVRVLNGSAGLATPPDLAFQVNGGPATQFNPNGVNPLILPVPGPYSITAVDFPGYTSHLDEDTSGITCTNVTLDAAQTSNPFCRITFTFIEPPTTTTTTTTTTTQPVTTTTGQAGQTTIHDSGSDVNNCNTVLVPDLQPPGNTKITVTIATDASPQPHFGDPITLSGTGVTLNIPASLLQLGVNAGLIKNGDQVPSTVTLKVGGLNTTEQTHSYVVNQSATIVVNGTKAQPLTAHINLPNTVWTPVSATQDVAFSEKSLKIVSHLNLPGLGAVSVTFTCNPTTAAGFIAVGATGVATITSPPPVGGTTLPPSGDGGGIGGVGGQASGASELPRTGSSPWPLFVVAAFCIDLGLLAIAAAKRRRRPLHQA